MNHKYVSKSQLLRTKSNLFLFLIKTIKMSHNSLSNKIRFLLQVKSKLRQKTIIVKNNSINILNKRQKWLSEVSNRSEVDRRLWNNNNYNNNNNNNNNNKILEKSKTETRSRCSTFTSTKTSRTSPRRNGWMFFYFIEVSNHFNFFLIPVYYLVPWNVQIRKMFWINFILFSIISFFPSGFMYFQTIIQYLDSNIKCLAIILWFHFIFYFVLNHSTKNNYFGLHLGSIVNGLNFTL